MEFGILGPLEVRDGGATIALGGVRERSLLAVLLLNANELVPTDRLVDELWGEEPPKTAVKTIHVYVSRLRKLLGAETIVTAPPGYVLRVGTDQIDVHCFERLAAEGRAALAAGDAQTAAGRLSDALALWRGAALSDFAYEPFAQAEAARLEELRLAALEDRIDAELGCGRTSELVGEIQALVARHPLRERLRGQMMLALYRSGRQAEALDVYRDARTTLVEELGIEPSRELSELERAILMQDASLEGPGTRRPLRAAGIFVGRAAEVARLVGAVEHAQGGRGSVVLIAGEPGIGKSRLIDEVAGHAGDRGLQVLRGRSWEAGGAPAFWPWVQVLRASVRASEPEQLRVLAGPGAASLAQLLPELAEALGDLPAPEVPGAEAARFQMFDAVARFVKSMGTAGRGLLIGLDDLHSADEPSLLLLQFLAGVLTDAPVVVVGAYRDTETGPGHPLERVLAELLREPVVDLIALQGLERPDIEDYIELTSGRTASDQVIDTLYDRTAGNALFVVETVRLLAAEGRLDRADPEVLVPLGVREAIVQRLERLPESAGAVLAGASVLGREFRPEALEQLAGANAAEALDDAIRGGIVTAAPGAPGRLRFAHALIRDVLYQELPARRRRELHRRAGEALARRHSADPGPHLAELAHHFFEAAATHEAATYARRAADRAVTLLAFEEAARLYELGLEAIDASDSPDDMLRCELLLALGEARMRAGGEAAAQVSFQRAAEVARTCGLPEQLARAALGHSGRFVWLPAADDVTIQLLEEALGALGDQEGALRAMVMARLAGAIPDRRSREPRASLSREAVKIARRLDDPAALAYALDGRLGAIWWPENPGERLPLATELLEIARRAGNKERVWTGHVGKLTALLELGELQAAEAELRVLTSLSEELRQPTQLWATTSGRAMFATAYGRFTEAEIGLREGFELGRDAHGDALLMFALQLFMVRRQVGGLEDAVGPVEQAAARYPERAILRAVLADVYAQLGREADARRTFDQAASDDFEAFGMDHDWLATMVLLSEVAWVLRDSGRAQTLYDLLEPYADRHAVDWAKFILGAVARSLGLLAATLSRWGDATAHFERALEMNARLGLAPWVAHAQYGFALALETRSQPGDAARTRELLAAAHTTYQELGMDVWASRVGESPELSPA